jgi:LPS sulfotransferase NodH
MWRTSLFYHFSTKFDLQTNQAKILVDMAKFVIFASARTGSTSLARVLGESRGVKMVFEPFSPDFTKWNPKEKAYSGLVTHEKVDKLLDEIFGRFNAMKTLDYQLSEKDNFTLLNRKDLRILFLTRSNLIEQIISDLVAHQVQNWQRSENAGLYKKLKPIDLDEMRKKIDYVTQLNKTYFNFLKKNRPGDFLPLYYEKLYSEDVNKNTATISKICNFLGIPIPPKDAIEEYMTPSKAKINYGDHYKNLPNYKEIEKKFGKIL